MTPCYWKNQGPPPVGSDAKSGGNFLTNGPFCSSSNMAGYVVGRLIRIPKEVRLYLHELGELLGRQ